MPLAPLPRLEPLGRQINLFLSNEQRAACEASWRCIVAGDISPLGFIRDILPADDLEARFHVGRAVCVLPPAILPLLISRETALQGPLDGHYVFYWSTRGYTNPPACVPVEGWPADEN